MLKHFFKTGLIYITGAIAWLAIIFILQSRCIVNIPFIVDGLLSKDINENLVENLTGSIAFRTRKFKCDNKYIFTVRYYRNGVSGNYVTKPLGGFVDVPSWKEQTSDNISTTYTDKNYRYTLYNTSDGINMKVFDK